MNRRFFSLICAACCLMPATPVLAQDLLDNVMKAKVLRVGVPGDLPPFGSLGADQQPQGLDVDMAQLIGAKLGVSVKLMVVPSAQRVAWLQEHKVDLVISTLGKNAEREKQIDFSNDYSSFYLAVFGPKALALRGPAEMAGKSIAVTKGSIEDQELVKLGTAGLTVERFDDTAAALGAYAQGKTQLVAAGVSAAMAAVAKNPQLDVDAKFVLKESRNFIGLPKGEDKLRDKVNEIIEAAKTSGELRKLSAKWFSRAGLKQ